jgi:hypothetical protein
MASVRFNGEFATKILGKLSHLFNAEVAGPLWRRITGHTNAVIINADFQLLISAVDFQAHRACVGVLADVLQGFTDDANHGTLDLGNELNAGDLFQVYLDVRAVNRNR